MTYACVPATPNKVAGAPVQRDLVGIERRTVCSVEDLPAPDVQCGVVPFAVVVGLDIVVRFAQVAGEPSDLGPSGCERECAIVRHGVESWLCDRDALLRTAHERQHRRGDYPSCRDSALGPPR